MSRDPGDNREPIEPEDPALAIAARHALHDEELIAAFATDGDGADDAARARSLVDRCEACRDLHADLVAIGGSLRETPNAATAAAAVRAPRDFRLSVETANRIRPGSVVPRLRDRIRAAISAFGRPLGMSMASLGVVGLLLGTLTLGGGMIGAAPEGADGGFGAAQGPAASAAAGGDGKLDTGAVSGPDGTAPAPGSTAAESLRMSFETLATTRTTAPPAAPSGPVAGGGSILPALIVTGSVVLLAGGLALLLVGSRVREPVRGR